MESGRQVTLVISQEQWPKLQKQLQDATIEFQTRSIRNFDGDSALTSVLITAGNAVVTKLVDGLSKLCGGLFRDLANREEGDDINPESDSLTEETVKIDLEIRRGDMVLTLRNALLADVERVIEFARVQSTSR